jgi:hypothetical protein
MLVTITYSSNFQNNATSLREAIKSRFGYDVNLIGLNGPNKYNIHLNKDKIIYSDVVASDNDTILTIIENNSSSTT